MDNDLKTKHLAQAGYLGPKAEVRARQKSPLDWSGKGGRTTNTVYAKQYMVVVGNLGQGLDFYGPFDTVAKATVWTRDNLHVGTTVSIEEFHDVRSEA